MSLADDLDAKRSEIIELMVRTNNPEGGTSDDEVRQFMVGYFSIVRAAAVGDFGPRDEYLASVVPALRQSGMPLSLMFVGLLRIATVFAAVLEAEHAKWLCDFQAEYATRMLATWEAAA